MTVLTVIVAFAGCIGADDVAPGIGPTETPATAYSVPVPDRSLTLLEHAELIPMPIGTDIAIHARIVRPDVAEPVPVIVQFTPYTAPGRAMAIEPQVSPADGRFENEFVRRGFAFAYADVRGTGDSGGCLDLRGQLDIEDADALTEWLGTQSWSNGKVGFIGASYPGSEAHIAALANNPHLGGVIPVVASTSFYNYHHKAGVPYSNHATTNTLYTAYATAPTTNPQFENYLTRQAREPAECDQATHITKQADQSGTYDSWWNDRDLRWRVGDVKVPVLMAQGLADWNVKPDHIDTWYNQLDNARKILIAGQWSHQYPKDVAEAYGDWWPYAAAFFDETLRGTHTGLFDANVAYVQDTDGAWHTYNETWPPAGAVRTPLNLTGSGLSFTDAPSGEIGWFANPASDRLPILPAGEQVILELPALDHRLHVSGTPRLNLTITSDRENVHLVARLEVLREGAWRLENHGYLNPIYREGVDHPVRLLPGKATPVTIDFYPQEDVFNKGESLRLVIRSVDQGRTIPAFDPANLKADLAGERPGQLWLPVVAGGGWG